MNKDQVKTMLCGAIVEKFGEGCLDSIEVEILDTGEEQGTTLNFYGALILPMLEDDVRAEVPRKTPRKAFKPGGFL